MRFTTESGSTYEMDGRRVRRLSGQHDPTPRQGLDGEWRDMDTIPEVEMGESVLMMWSLESGEATVTSRVVGIEK